VYTSTKRIRDAAKDPAKVDVPPLPFGESRATGKDAASLTVPYAGDAKVTYEVAGDAFKRTQGGRQTEVSPANVVIIKTDITEVPGVEDVLGSPSVDARLTGEGPAVVLSGGKRFDGKWSRSGTDQFRFTDAGGAEIRLRPGLTWFHVVPTSFDVG
jgi:hypothetical protein